MGNDNFDRRLENAVQRVRELRKFKDIGLAISEAANEFEIDRTELARHISKLATAAKLEKKSKLEAAKKAAFDKWKARDDERYGWMNKD